MAEHFTGPDGRHKAIATGYDDSFATLLQALFMHGLEDLHAHWAPVDDDTTIPTDWHLSFNVDWTETAQGDSDYSDPGPKLTAVWRVTVKISDRSALLAGFSSPTRDHQRGVIDAVGGILRQMGASVTLVEIPDHP